MKIELSGVTWWNMVIEPEHGSDDWRVNLTSNRGALKSTEFPMSSGRSPNSTQAISEWLQKLANVNVGSTRTRLNRVIYSERLPGSSLEVLGVVLTPEVVIIWVTHYPRYTSEDIDGIMITSYISDMQYEFFRRLIEAMDNDNRETPIDVRHLSEYTAISSSSTEQ